MSPQFLKFDMSRTLPEVVEELTSLPTFLDRAQYLLDNQDVLGHSSWEEMRLSNGLEPLLDLASDPTWSGVPRDTKVSESSLCIAVYD